MSSTDITRVARISPKGQTTVPKEFRDKHGIDTPGRVRFRETEDGELVIESVPHPDDKLGSRADHVREGEVKETLRQLRGEDEDLERQAIERHLSINE